MLRGKLRQQPGPFTCTELKRADQQVSWVGRLFQNLQECNSAPWFYPEPVIFQTSDLQELKRPAGCEGKQHEGNLWVWSQFGLQWDSVSNIRTKQQQLKIWGNKPRPSFPLNGSWCVSLHTPSCHQTFQDPSASASQMLGLQACTITCATTCITTRLCHFKLINLRAAENLLHILTWEKNCWVQCTESCDSNFLCWALISVPLTVSAKDRALEGWWSRHKVFRVGSNSVIQGSLDLDPQRSIRGYTEETTRKDLVEDSYLQAEALRKCTTEHRHLGLLASELWKIVWTA